MNYYHLHQDDECGVFDEQKCSCKPRTIQKKHAVMEWVTVERGKPFEILPNAKIVKMEPIQGTKKYRLWYVMEA